MNNEKTIHVTATITKSTFAFSGVRVIEKINGKEVTLKLFSAHKYADQFIKENPNRTFLKKGKDVWPEKD